MYRYVSKKEAKPRKAYCRKVMESLQVELKKHCGIEIQYQMIGSGAKNLVTRNGNGPYDLDYNISFTELPDNYRDDPGKLKAAVRQQLDRLIKEPFSRGRIPHPPSPICCRTQKGTELRSTWMLP